MKLLLNISLLLLSINLSAQDKQPFAFQVKKLMETLDFLGTPLVIKDKETIDELINNQSETVDIKAVLDKYVIFDVQINPESRVKVNVGAAKPTLLQSGWTTFLIKVNNQAGITAVLNIESEQAKRVYDGGEKIYGFGHKDEGVEVRKNQIQDRWLDMGFYPQNAPKTTLSGLEIEYFIVQLYSRDAGKRAAKFVFNCGQATQDMGFRNETDVLFNCVSAYKITLNILDEDQKPTTASLIIKDEKGHIYPSLMKRLAPDFFFQSQIYRADGEAIDLPIGNYTLKYNRGPEYLTKTKTFTVNNNSNQTLKIDLERWINPAKLGWYSGDHHIHAAGCSHYTSPTQGVNPEDMMRHIVGEGVNVGSVLTWGPGYYHQKQFFEGKDNKLSSVNNLLRYDLEISGFPSGVALRILPSSHTNPIFVLVDNKPIRANKKSAEWCLKAVEVCWQQKQNLIAKGEKLAAQKDYEDAKKVYLKIIEESK